MVKAVTVASILLCLAFAGCTGPQDDAGAGHKQQADPVDFDENTGAVAGLITDDQIQPIAGALVAVLDQPEKTTTSDQEGRFTLSNVMPGTIRLAAQALGYGSVARSIEVQAGEVLELQLTLLPLESQDPFIETFIWDGFIGCSVAYVRSVLQLGNGDTCPGGSAENQFFHEPYKNGWPVTMKGLTVEAAWRTEDFLGFDVNQRETPTEMYARVRQQSPVHMFLERCGDYTKTHFGRQPMPCEDEQVEDSKMHIETWFVGQYQEETHNLDVVCQQSTPYWPAYQQGCYGLGVAFDLRWTNYVGVFHRELPPDAATYSGLPDG